MVLILLFGSLSGFSIPVYAATGGTSDNPTILNADQGEATLTSGYYELQGNFTNNGRLTISGDVHLILNDDANVTISGGIECGSDNYLTIEGNVGRLTAIARSGTGAAGIGGNEYDKGGIITINGGKITAEGARFGAGIGGGNRGSGGNITINGGEVTALAGDSIPGYLGMTLGNGAGIGGGANGSNDSITINGGVITARGGVLGADIGGGGAGSGGTILINGGTVTSAGGDKKNIGSGDLMTPNGQVIINGGSIKGRTSTQATNGTDNLYLTTLTVGSGTNGLEFTAAGYGLNGKISKNYGMNDVVTRDGGKVYIYLPSANYTANSIAMATSDADKYDNGASINVTTSGATGTLGNSSSHVLSNATLNVKKDGTSWHKHGRSLTSPHATLKNAVSETATLYSFLTGPFDVYDSSANTGVSIASNNIGTLNYKTTTAEDFSLSTNTVVYDGKPKAVTITPQKGIGTITSYYTGVGSTIYDTTTTAPSDAGTYTVTIDATEGVWDSGILYLMGNGLDTGTLTINKATITNGGGATTVIYGDAFFNDNKLDLSALDSLFNIDANAGVRTYTLDTGGSGQGTMDEDNKTLNVTTVGTFIIGLETAETANAIAGEKVTATLTVIPRKTSFKVADLTPVYYTGLAHTPTVTVKAGSKTLMLDKDYKVDYKNNVNHGTAVVDIVGEGNYAGSKGRKTFTINQATPSIILSASGKTRPGSVSLTATLPGDATGTVMFYYGSSIPVGLPVSVVAGSAQIDFTPVTAVNDYNFTAVYSGDTNYETSTSNIVDHSFIKGEQEALALSGLDANYTYGTGSITLGTTGGTTDGAVTYSSNNPNAAVINGNILTIVGVGEFTVTAEMAGDVDYNAVSVTSFKVTVNPATLDATITPKNKVYDGLVTSEVDTISYTGILIGDQVEINGGSIQFDDADAGEVKTVSVDQPYTLAGNDVSNYVLGAIQVNTADISQAEQDELKITGLDTIYLTSDAPVTLGVTGGTTNGVVTYTSSNTSVATIAGNILTIVGAGDFTVTATLAGDNNYHAVSTTSRKVTVDQTIYTVLSHFGNWSGTGTVAARVDADETKFFRLMYDGKEIDAANYTITHGSTIITLKETHLKNYAAGTHWFVAEFSDGRSERIRLDVTQAKAGDKGSDKGVAINSLPETGAPNDSEKTATGVLPTTGDIGKPIDLLISLIGLALSGLMLWFIDHRRKVN
ncbi:beta strand repeat-containing protein [Lactococcus reticulitermitis]|nr:YDG domain-containing protein [Lactococcus reticulitermitis]